MHPPENDVEDHLRRGELLPNCCPETHLGGLLPPLFLGGIKCRPATVSTEVVDSVSGRRADERRLGARYGAAVSPVCKPSPASSFFHVSKRSRLQNSAVPRTRKPKESTPADIKERSEPAAEGREGRKRRLPTRTSNLLPGRVRREGGERKRSKICGG
jgi:hypothetical protein